MKEEYKQFYEFQLDKFVMLMADFACERCGRRARNAFWFNRDGWGVPETQFKDDIQLAVHHRDGNPQNNRLANLICLCQRCHLSAERLNRRFKQVTLLKWIVLSDRKY